MNHAEPRPPHASCNSPRLRQNSGSNSDSSASCVRLPRQAGSDSMAPVAVAMRRLLVTYTMTLNFKPPLQHVCLLRLSAIGDTCHALAALRAFQAAWPQIKVTWIIGKLEAKLMTTVLPEIEFITFDKSATLKELWRLRTALRARRFGLLLDMQLS